jgi:hypothetical protein
MTTYTAAELRSKFEAGLTLVGQDADGELEFVGTHEQWRGAAGLARYYSENNGSDYDGTRDAEGREWRAEEALYRGAESRLD